MTSDNSANGRIAIIGNMNNCGFSLMRYFRDLGADAHLLLYANDGIGSLAHFRPGADTWEIEKWRPYIHQLQIYNWTTSLVPDLQRRTIPPSRKFLREQLRGYDTYLGSGTAPAVFERIGQALSCFFPYEIGVEWVDSKDFEVARRRAVFNKPFLERLRRLQIAGIGRAKYCFNAEMGDTALALERIGRPFERLSIPLVYNREATSKAKYSNDLRETIGKIEAADISLFCSSRLLWDRKAEFSPEAWKSFSKNSNWQFLGIAEFIRKHPSVQLLLAIVEYGPDVDATKRLVAELGLEPYVLWLPKMPRREIMLLLSASDIGVGQFYIDPGTLWGGTGWEILASGRPLLQSFNFTLEGYEIEFGHPPPPILDVKSPEGLAKHLAEMYYAPERRKAIGKASANWFKQYNGIGLAKQWLDRLA